ncbi:TNF receptor-associated factor 5-like isoform X1 [Hydra vulgaris]|uniref:TNF receptor-associated factor 5-like isoform X1 n=1 Tax=Hydra vulgaris TaxID=6087 RepID=A0ABM4DK17_HYDVU
MKCSDAEKIGGYNAHFLQELLDEYECPVCQMVLREPILTVCGHRLCLSCSEEMRKRNNGVLVCPLDNTILKPGQTFPDKAIERAILQLKVKCNNFLKKCQWTGELKAINNHLGSCEYQEVKCPNGQCSTSLLRKELTDHIKINCIYRFINCQHCNQKILFCEKQNHMETCRCLPLYCVNQCGMVILRKEMSSHITDSCASTIVPCQYFYIGCNFKGMRKEQDTHVNSSIQNHLSLAISKVVANEREITILKNEMEMKKEQDQFLVTSKMVELEKKILVIEKEMKIKNTKPNNEQVGAPWQTSDQFSEMANPFSYSGPMPKLPNPFANFNTTHEMSNPFSNSDTIFNMATPFQYGNNEPIGEMATSFSNTNPTGKISAFKHKTPSLSSVEPIFFKKFLNRKETA